MAKVVRPRVRVRLPSVLEPVAGSSELSVEADDIQAALEASFAQVPVLRHHLTLESGQLRPHVLCLHNGTRLDPARLADTLLEEGDEVMIFQAISGG